MKPVHQDQFGKPSADNPGGNCFSSVLASLLELPLSEVPHFYAYFDGADEGEDTHTKWWEITQWLREKGYGIIAFNLSPEHIQHAIKTIGPYTTIIGSGWSPRFPDVMHAVIGYLTKEGEWVTTFDPRPDGTGLTGEPSMVEWLFKRLEA